MHVIDSESRTLRKGNSLRKTFVTETFQYFQRGRGKLAKTVFGRSLMSGIRLSAESTSFLEYGANRRSSEQRCLLESRRDHFARSRLLFTGLLPIFEGQDWNDTEEEIISLSRPPFLSTRALGGAETPFRDPCEHSLCFPHVHRPYDGILPRPFYNVSWMMARLDCRSSAESFSVSRGPSSSVKLARRWSGTRTPVALC